MDQALPSMKQLQIQIPEGIVHKRYPHLCLVLWPLQVHTAPGATSENPVRIWAFLHLSGTSEVLGDQLGDRGA